MSPKELPGNQNRTAVAEKGTDGTAIDNLRSI